MPLPSTLQDREMQKFDLNGNDEVIVRTAIDGTISGDFTPSGLNISGRVTEVTINDSSWTALPPVPLTNRNAISIQNTSGFNMKVNYDPLLTTYVGVFIPNNNERYYDIKDTIIVYGRLAPGSGIGVINVEELA